MSQVSDYSSYKNSLQQMQDSYNSERAETRANQENEIKRTKQEAEENITKAKEEYNQRLQSERAQARDEVRRLKDELYDSSGKNSAKESKERQSERSDLSRYHDQIKKEADQRISRAESRLNTQSDRQQEIQDAKISEALAAQKKSDYREMSQYQDELSEYQNSGHDVDHDRALARQQSIAENERSYSDDKKRIIDGYERELAALKTHQEGMAEQYDKQLSEAQFDSNHHAQDQIQNQKKEFSRIYHDGLIERKSLEDAYAKQLKDLNERHEQSSSRVIDQSMMDRDRAIANKDTTYQNYLAENSKKTNYDLKVRDDKIQELQTTDDPLKVSPFVVQKINDRAQMQNERQLTAAQAEYSMNLDAARTRDQEERRALADNYQTRVVTADRSARKEIDLQNRQVREAFTDMQENKSSTIQTLNDQKRDQLERAYQKHAVELAEAQKDKQEALVDQRDHFVYEKNTAVGEVEHTQRIKDRDWATKTNELKRDFDAKLAEERENHEAQMKLLRTEDDKKLRDQDRTAKRILDDKVHSYEYMIEQQELAFKEKERFLTEHYEEELDKMKRTNAHLIEKKS